MKIQIAEKLAPFSHIPGMSCVLPGTHLELDVFPTLLRIGEGKVELRLQLTGPVRDFTVQLDLERNAVFVFGEAKEGFYRLRVAASDQGVELFADRVPEAGIAYFGSLEGVLQRKETLFFPFSSPFFLPSKVEKLSLGNHKSQDWWGVVRRFDLREILPALFVLGQKVPPLPPQELTGAARLLAWPLDGKEELLVGLEKLCRAAFSKMLVPRLKDEEHQGLCSEEPVQGNCFFVLQEAYRRIRALFFRAEDCRVVLLPHNPFEAGRLIGLQAKRIGEFDLEWSRGTLRRAVFRAASSGDLLLDLPRPLKSFRVRRKIQEEGRRLEGRDPLVFEANGVYFLDRFQK